MMSEKILSAEAASELVTEIASLRASLAAVTAERDTLKGVLLDQPWHKQCDIIPDYMPPFPAKDTRPTVQIRYNTRSGNSRFLRYSHGPKQGFFWDIYGDDFLTVELAIVALAKAPYPPQEYLIFRSTAGAEADK